jgi:hypothetical protein
VSFLLTCSALLLRFNSVLYQNILCWKFHAQIHIHTLHTVNVRLIALDFDLTIVDVHTGGDWTLSEHELAQHVRPEMKCLMQESSQRGLRIAVASFSVQESLIQQVLQRTMPTVMATTTTARVPIRGGRNRSEPWGKRDQLTLVLDDINKSMNETTATATTMTTTNHVIDPTSTILIDDDKNNIRVAQKDGYLSLWLDPQRMDGFFPALVSFLRTT